MILDRLAADLDEIRRKTETFADTIGDALTFLSEEEPDVGTARRHAIAVIATAIEGQESLELRCQSLALIVRQVALLPANTPTKVYDEIWSAFRSAALSMD